MRLFKNDFIPLSNNPITSNPVNKTHRPNLKSHVSMKRLPREVPGLDPIRRASLYNWDVKNEH